MSRDGFPIADLDTGLLADPKVVALARRLQDPSATAAHLLLYVSVVLESWGAGERVAFETALPAWWLTPADVEQANLSAVGLLDADGRVPERAWASWFGPAFARREVAREKGRKGGRASSSSSPSQAQLEPESSAAEDGLNPSVLSFRQPGPTSPGLPSVRTHAPAGASERDVDVV